MQPAKRLHWCREQIDRRSPSRAELELPLAFVNTLDVEEPRDEFGSAEALRAWLAGRGLLGRRAR